VLAVHSQEATLEDVFIEQLVFVRYNREEKVDMHTRMIWSITCKVFLDIWLNKSTLIGLIYPITIALVFYLINHLVGGSSPNLLIYNPGNSDVV